MSTANCIRSDIQQMKAYAVTDVPAGFIKLDAMESPYDYPEDMKKELGRALAAAPIRLYPNPGSCGLLQVLRDTYAIPAEASLVLGNGSDELIERLTMLVSKPGAKVLAPAP